VLLLLLLVVSREEVDLAAGVVKKKKKHVMVMRHELSPDTPSDSIIPPSVLQNSIAFWGFDLVEEL